MNTGSPSSKYEHRQASALVRNIQNIRICMGRKPIVSVTCENERISLKNSLPYLKCVLPLSCVVHGPIYVRFMGYYVNGFLSIYIKRKPLRLNLLNDSTSVGEKLGTHNRPIFPYLNRRVAREASLIEQ